MTQKPNPRNLNDILGRNMSEDEAGLSQASILQKGVHIATPSHKENALTFLFGLLGDCFEEYFRIRHNYTE